MGRALQGWLRSLSGILGAPANRRATKAKTAQESKYGYESLTRQPTPRRPTIRAAVAAGERLRSALAWEWDQRTIDASNWRESIREFSPTLVLLEITNGTIPGWGRPTDADLSELGGIARAIGSPIVIWVTSAGEDLESVGAYAEHAGFVYLADAASLGVYRSRWPDKAIDVLGPAAQPQIHTPVIGGPGTRRSLGGCLVVDSDDSDLRQDADLLVIADAVKPLCNSDFGVLPARRETPALPPALATRVFVDDGDEPIRSLVSRHKVLVDAGPRDPASTWWVVEAGAAQTAVVSTKNRATNLPPDVMPHVGIADDQKALRGEIVARLHQPELRDREAMRLHRTVLSHHTYSRRVDTILKRLGQATARPAPEASVVVSTNRRQQIENILSNVARQAYPHIELIIVLHGISVDHDKLCARAKELGVRHLTVVDADASQTLGACLNLGVDRAAGSLIAKMDDDNYYGAHYVTDLVFAFSYSDASIVGKWAHYVWLRSSDAVVLRYADAEHTYARRVQGGSMVIDRELVRRLRFADIPRGVDTDLLDRSMAEGVKIYSADRFNFVSIRGANENAHTWQVPDTAFMTATGQLVFYGDPRTHVEV